MENIPTEILESIIGYLDKKDLLSVRLVTKTWQSYAEDYLRKKVAHFPLEIDKDVSDLIEVTSWRNENTIPPLFVKFSISGVISKEILEELSNKYGNVIQSLRCEVKDYRVGPTIDLSNILDLLIKTPNINEIYIMNHYSDVDKKRKYQLSLPKLRILELKYMDTNFVKLILDSSPNIQQVKCGVRKGDDITEDYITIFESIAARAIELKFGIWIDFGSIQVNLQRLREMAKIENLKVTGLILYVQNVCFDAEEFSPVRKSIEKFIRKHSTTLKLLEVRYSCFLEGHLKLNLKNLDNLEQLKLKCCSIGKKIMLQVNLGQAPMLKEVKIGLNAELNVQSALLLLKHFCIAPNNTSEYFKRLQLLDDSVRLETLSLNFREETLTTKKADERLQLLNNLLLSQAKGLKVLKIEAKNSTGMNNLQLPIMDNLQKLKLLNLPFGKNEKLKLQQSSFPHLKFLKLDKPLYRNPSLNESLESVRILILKSGSLLNFENTIQRFPNLKKLQIKEIDADAGVLPLVFTNLTHLEELIIGYGRPGPGSETRVTWDELTGNSEVVDFVNEPSTRILKTSLPNLGDLIYLKRLKIGDVWLDDEMDEIKAVSFLISCGKLENLRFFEGISWDYGLDLEELALSFIEIIESNNTGTNIQLLSSESEMQI